MFKLTYIRHGETDYNANGLFQGQSDIPLNDLGMKQADLAGCYMKDVKFDKIYSSDLSRCVQTADMIIKRNACSPPEMVQDSRLREKSFGDFEGRPFHEYHTWKKREKKKHHDDSIPGGETEEQVVTRIESFLDHLFTEMSSLTLLYQCEKGDQNSVEEESENAEKSAGSRDVEDDNITPFQDLGYPKDSHMPHVLISSHGMLLRIMLRLLHEKYKCRMGDGLSLKGKSPNTGLTGFIFKTAPGRPTRIEVKFVFSDHHLANLSSEDE